MFFLSFCRAKQFMKRNIWVLIFKWNGHMFRFIAKTVFPQNIGKDRNDGNYLIAHVQYIGLSSMAAKYAYTISMFQAKSRNTSGKFESVVTSTQRDLETQRTEIDADIFIETQRKARGFCDNKGDLCFIIHMKSLTEDLGRVDENMDIDNSNYISKDSRKRRASSPIAGPSVNNNTNSDANAESNAENHTELYAETNGIQSSVESKK